MRPPTPTGGATMTTTMHRAAREVDPDRLDAFIGRRHRRPRRDRQRRRSSSSATGSGSTARCADGEPRHRRGARRAAPAPRRATSRRGWPTRPPAATSSTTPTTGTWSMTPEQAAALADPDSPAFFAGSMQLALGVLRDVPAHRGAVPHRRRLRLARARRATCSRAPSGSSGPATSPTWSPTGCPRSTAWSPSSSAAPRSSTSAAVTAPRRS